MSGPRLVAPRLEAPRLVALGGGHGLYATLRALRELSDDVTAIVTVADDGGSSGRIRRELGLIPPGDLRMAISALMSEDNAGRWQEIVQHRFGGQGALAGHPVGNLMLAGLCEVYGDPVVAVAELGRLFGIRGRVLPMSPTPLDIEADVTGTADDPRISRVIRGQVAVATTVGQVRRVRLTPAEPPATPAALEAIATADLVTIGPGSWFSSVLPHVLVPQQVSALRETSARKVLLLNLVPQPGETGGFTPERHLQVLAAHAPGLRFDDVVVDPGALADDPDHKHLIRAAKSFGARVHIAPVAVPGRAEHDPARVARVIEGLLTGARGGTID